LDEQDVSGLLEHIPNYI